jgi:hypothetical protein
VVEMAAGSSGGVRGCGFSHGLGLKDVGS